VNPIAAMRLIVLVGLAIFVLGELSIPLEVPASDSNRDDKYDNADFHHFSSTFSTFPVIFRDFNHPHSNL